MFSNLIKRTIPSLAAIALFAIGPFASIGQEGGSKENLKENLNDIALEVAALQAIDQLELNPAHLKLFEEAAKTTADKKDRQRDPAKVSVAYRKALLELHSELIKGGEETDDLDAKLDELANKDEPELDTDFEISEMARKKAPWLLNKLSPVQVATIIGGADNADPAEVLFDALDAGRDLKGDDWKETRDEAAESIGAMLGGVNLTRANEFKAKANKLLDSLYAAKIADDEKLRAKIADELQKLVGKIGPMDILQNNAEVSLAETLSNPRLGAALEARRKATAKK